MVRRLLTAVSSVPLLAAVLALAVVQAAPAGAVEGGSSAVFINELHYDNASTDVGEAVEIAGPAGTDLTGWSVVFYNGSNGTVYRTEALTGTLSDVSGGYGFAVLSLPTNGIQNGGPDGLALVDSGGGVVQFLSYEGTFAGVGGPADGLTSTDIGVTESGATPIGNSLQLTGSGSTYQDFTWAPDAAGTFGAANIDQSFGGGPTGPGEGDLVITEVLQNPSAVFDSAGEWFEVFNTTGADIDLDGWTIRDADFDAHVVAGSVVVPAGGYAVLGNNADPGTNGGVTVAYEYSGIFLSNGADELILQAPDSTVVDSIAWDGGPAWPDPNGASMQLCDVAVDNDDGANWSTGTATFGLGDVGTPGAGNDVDCPGGPGTVTIMEIQGSGDVSPLVGEAVITSGVVTGIVDNGFYIQDPTGDGDPATSDGIFVFSSASVSQGDAVEVEGTAAEFFGATQVAASLVTVTGVAAIPPATAIDLETLGGAFEPFEGMLVTPGTLFAGDVFDYLRFGEIVAYPFLPVQPTEIVEPGAAAAQLAADLAAAAIIVEDGRGGTDNPVLPFLVSDGGVDRLARWGDTLPDATGVLAFTFGNFKLVPTTGDPLVPGETFQPTNPRPAGAPDPGGSITAASFNTLNFWTTDGGQRRGARSLAQYEIQLAKLVDALVALDADVVALQELQNDPTGDGSRTFDIGKESAEALADAVNASLGETRYGWIDTGVIGTDAIKVGFIYDMTAVTPVGDPIVVGADDPTYQPDRNRPSLVQGFEENATGARFTAVSVHFKSKSGSELDDAPDGICVDGDPSNDTADCDQGDGAAFFNAARTAAAEVLAAFLADPANLPDPDVIVLGDFNAYTMEDPLDVFVETNGYANLGKLSAEAFSYTFFGLGGNLDHAVSNPALTPQVTGAEVFDINGPESNNQVYFESGFPGQLPLPDRYRSSDHSPIIVGLDLDFGRLFECGSITYTEAQLLNAGLNLIIGTDAGETIIGTDGNDFIFAAGGRDRVNGQGGDDIICGGDGNDTLIGQAGDDIIDGGAGRDVGNGGQGTDAGFGLEVANGFES